MQDTIQHFHWRAPINVGLKNRLGHYCFMEKVVWCGVVLFYRKGLADALMPFQYRNDHQASSYFFLAILLHMIIFNLLFRAKEQ